MLDPHPDNLLGTGALDANTENSLLQRGIVFATTVSAKGVPPFLLTSRRPIAETAARFFETLDSDLHGVPARFRVPAPSVHP